MTAHDNRRIFGLRQFGDFRAQFWPIHGDMHEQQFDQGAIGIAHIDGHHIRKILRVRIDVAANRRNVSDLCEFVQDLQISDIAGMKDMNRMLRGNVFAGFGVRRAVRIGNEHKARVIFGNFQRFSLMAQVRRSGISRFHGPVLARVEAIAKDEWDEGTTCQTGLPGAELSTLGHRIQIVTRKNPLFPFSHCHLPALPDIIEAMKKSIGLFCVAATLFAACDDNGKPPRSTSSSSSSSSSGEGASSSGQAGSGGNASSSGSSSGTAGMGGNGGNAGAGGMGGNAGASIGGAGPGGGGNGGAGGSGGGGPGILSQPTYDAVMVFQNEHVADAPMGIAWDGSSFWVGGNGTLGGFTEARYDGTGKFLADYQPGIGFAAIYTKGDGTSPVFARANTWLVVEKQISPGQWSGVMTLAGPSPPAATGIAWDADHNEFIALIDGILNRWDSTGQALAQIPFQDFGTMNGEGNYPANRRVAWAYGYYLTYSKQYISAWNGAGIRVASAKLNGAGIVDFDSAWSFSFAQGKAWVVDSAQGMWRGYVIAP